MIIGKLFDTIKYRIKDWLRRRKLYLDRLRYSPVLHEYRQKSQLIVALPTIDWHTPLFQRPQHLARHLAQLGVPFIYTTCNLKYDHVSGFHSLATNLVITNKWYLVANSLKKSWLFLLSTQQLTTIKDVIHYRRDGHRIIYDYVDDIHEDISGSSSMVDFLRQRHEYIKGHGIADLVLCVSKKLYREMLEYYPQDKVLLCQNGVDYRHFHLNPEVTPVPTDMAAIIKKGLPIIGYYGALAQWLDYDLINQTAKSHPEWSFVFIGIDYNGGLSKLDLSLPNMHFLGQKGYRILPQYGIRFDVAIIPFLPGKLAQSTSPLKMYEYMAMNIPMVVTQDLHECYGFPGVLVAATRADFSLEISQALHSAKNSNILFELDRTARDNTWGKRAKQIVNYIYGAST